MGKYGEESGEDGKRVGKNEDDVEGDDDLKEGSASQKLLLQRERSRGSPGPT